jgi:hypothetical protein
VLVGHYDHVGKVIEEWEKAGWHLHTHKTAGDVGVATAFVNHYLLFQKGEKVRKTSSKSSFFGCKERAESRDIKDKRRAQ